MPNERLARRPDGRIELTLETVWRDGTRALILEPHDLLARLVAAIPPPRRPILRYHGAFSAHHPLRARIVPAAPPAQRSTPPPDVHKTRRVRVEDSAAAAPRAPESPSEPKTSARGGLALVNQPLDWATLLQRVYDIDALACPCGGRLRFVALVTEREPVREILVAMRLDPTPPARAPPRQRNFAWPEPA